MHRPESHYFVVPQIYKPGELQGLLVWGSVRCLKGARRIDRMRFRYQSSQVVQQSLLNLGLRQLGCGLPSHVYFDDNEDCREDRLLDHSKEPCESLDKRIDPNSDN